MKSAEEKYNQMKEMSFDDIKNNMTVIPLIICIIGCLCLLGPVRKKFKEFWEKCFKGDADDNAISYASKATQFTDCYDICNPLTYKQGKMRLLNVQIEYLES